MSQQSEAQTPAAQATEAQAQQPEMLYLPETMKNWPWPRAINPYYEEVTRESNAWFKSFKPFNERSQYAYDSLFHRTTCIPCISIRQQGASEDRVFFVVDEYTDVEPLPVVKEMIEIVIDAIKNPSKPRPEGEIIVLYRFWARGEKTATPEAAKHVDEYFQTRRENIGARPSYVPGELHLSIPDYAFYHPVMKELEYLIADLCSQDIASYNKEQATGDDRHNILTIVMHQFNLSLPDAMKWVVKYHEEVEAKFLDGLKRVPSWGKEIDDQVAVYIEHLAGWPRCNDCWNFESGRYFGSKGLHKENVEVPIVDAL